jgi:hypothetical protein
MLEVMSVPGHDDVHMMFSEKPVNSSERFGLRAKSNARKIDDIILGHPFSGKRLIFSALIASAGVKRVAQNDHDKFSLSPIQGCLQPGPLISVHTANDARINGN